MADEAPPQGGATTPQDKGEEKGKDKFGEAEKENPDIVGAKRGCTDIACFCLFLIMWILWIILAIMAFTDGCPDNCNDPRKLIYGYDSHGCMCGKKCTSSGIDNTGKYSLYIPDPRSPTNRLCLEKCPPDFAFNKTVSIATGTYECPNNVCNVAGQSSLQFYVERTQGAVLSANGFRDNCFLPGANKSDCWYPTYPTSGIMFKCIPRIPANFTPEQMEALSAVGLPMDSASFTSAMAFMANPAGQIGTLIAELSMTWGIILASIGIAVLLGFLWMMLLRLFALVMMYVTIILFMLVLVLCTIFAWDKTGKIQVFNQVAAKTGQNITALVEAAGVPNAVNNQTPALYLAFAIIFTVVTVIYLFLMLIFLKRIVIAIKVIREAAKSMAAMPFLIFQPIFTLLSLCILYLWAGFITVFLISAGNFDVTTGTFTYSGGSCTNLVGKTISLNEPASLLTLTLASSLWMKRGFYSIDSGANWMASPAGGFNLSSSLIKGSNCSRDALTGIERCTVNSTTASSPTFPVGGCLGHLGGDCKQDHLNALTFTSPGSNTPGFVSWSPTLGLISFDIAPNMTIKGGTVRVAMRLSHCSDGGTPCIPWSFSGLEFFPGLNSQMASWGLQKLDVVTSAYNLTYPEVVRACNLYGKEEKARETLLTSKQADLRKQGLVDMQELTPSLWALKPTVDNWKSFLPVTLDGNSYNYFVVYHLFMFLWTNNFTVSAAYFILAGSVATWYWTQDKKTLSGPIRKSTWRFVRYHMGTVCVGSFIIAVVQLIRILFNYFVSRAEQFKENPLVKVFVCIVNCCLWCLEKVIGYINKNAYIMCATHGFYFCKAAFKGFSLLMRNIMRVAAVNVTAGVLLFIGKLFICFCTLAICYGIFTVLANDLGLTSGPPFLSLIMITIIGWFIGASFMNTFEAAVDTIFLSFLYDQEVNNGKDKPYLMADSLKSSLGVHNSKVAPAAQ